MKNITLLFILGSFICVKAQSWKMQNSFEATSLSTIQFFDSLNGYTLGFETDEQGQFSIGIGKYTSNGGKSWKPSSLNQVNVIPFRSHSVSNTLGFFVGSDITGFGVFGKTTNGGLNWNTDKHTTRLFDLHFYTGKRGIIAGRNGYIGLTYDTGKTWQFEKNIFSSTIYSIDVIDINNQNWILACGAGGNYGYSKDSGKTWNTGNLNAVGELTSVSMDKNGNAWMCSFNGEIFRSSDTGKTWIRHYSNNFDVFNHMTTDRSNKFWLCGDYGAFMTTFDTGWISHLALPGEHDNVFDNISDACFSIENVGWFCTSEGKIFSTKYKDTSSNSSALSEKTTNQFLIGIRDESISISNLNSFNLIYNFELLSLDGKLIFEGTLNSDITSIPIESIPKGIYLLNIKGNSHVISKPIYLY